MLYNPGRYREISDGKREASSEAGVDELTGAEVNAVFSEKKDGQNQEKTDQPPKPQALRRQKLSEVALFPCRNQIKGKKEQRSKGENVEFQMSKAEGIDVFIEQNPGIPAREHAVQEEECIRKRACAEEDPGKRCQKEGPQNSSEPEAEGVLLQAGLNAEPPAKGLQEVTENLIQPVKASPDDEGPGGSVPDAADEEGDHDVAVFADARAPASSKRNVNIIAEPRAQGNMPASPEAGDALCKIRRPEIDIQLKTKNSCGADRDGGVACKIGIDLKGEGKGSDDGLHGSAGKKILPDIVHENSGAVRDDHLHEKAPQHQGKAGGYAKIRRLFGLRESSDLRKKAVCSCNRACRNLREEADKERIVREASLSRDFSVEDIGEIADGLEQIEGDSDRKNQGKAGGNRVLSQCGKQRIDILKKEACVFEDNKDQNKKYDRADKASPAGGRTFCMLHPQAGQKADSDDRHQHEKKTHVEAKIKEKAAEQKPASPESPWKKAEHQNRENKEYYKISGLKEHETLREKVIMCERYTILYNRTDLNLKEWDMYTEDREDWNMEETGKRELEAPADPILQEDLDRVADDALLEKELRGKRILVTGATGLVGSWLIRALACMNRRHGSGMRIYGVIRNAAKADAIYGDSFRAREDVRFLTANITAPDFAEKVRNESGELDLVIHGAAVTASKMMVEQPVETIMTAIEGTRNVLELAKAAGAQRFVYLSSMEMYGTLADESGRDIPATEDRLGFLDLTKVRTDYPESKRMCENLCIGFGHEYGLSVMIARLSQTFGAGILPWENRVFSQFARSAMQGTDIVLHTKGLSEGNYCYTRDSVRGILTIAVRGEAGQAYNVSNEKTHTTIAKMAQLVAEKIAGGAIHVVYDIPETNAFGYAADTKLFLDASKLRALGWEPEADLEEMYRRLIASMKYSMENGEGCGTRG